MILKRGGEGKAQGLEHPPLPTYLLPVAMGTAGSFPGGDGPGASATWDISVPPLGDGTGCSSRSRQH